MSNFSARWLGHVRLAMLRLVTDQPADENARICILRDLARCPGLSATVSLLHDGMSDYGLSLTRDQVRVLVKWLADQGLVARQVQPAEGAMLTQAGLDVAQGHTTCPGVAPLPTIAWVVDGLNALTLTVSTLDVEEQIAWLAQQGLVANQPGLLLATPRGREVAMGRAAVDGVRAPSPSAIMAAAANAAKGVLGGGA
ncbi:hypothetical protein [Telmatospirillum sp. J64-1]|uniref:VpaChn25_0724 family phage protein n=1 Tax=Telmatospirillum sp. J64-1 TaxID=2502183 RepID=UPI00115DEF43|nr:hypothetical protein [Telmatospirillum sp. J64-1]